MSLFIGCATTEQPIPVNPKETPSCTEDGFKIEVHINDLKIYVVSERGWMPQECQDRGVDACLCTDPLSIWIIGHRYKGKIYVDELYLGHEVEHILNLFTFHLDELQIIDPDEFHME